MTRRDRLIRDRIADPYRMRAKLKEPTVCAECGAVWRLGRWQWGRGPHEADHKLCPACKRIADGLPAGVLTLDGPFVDAHRTELLALMHHEAKREASRHPMNRLMSVEEEAGALTLTTTETHLAERLGKAVRAAYAGALTRRHPRGEASLRLHWHR